MPIVKKLGFANIQGFADSKDFGFTDSGNLVYIVDTSTWKGVFENGLDVVERYELRPPPESESVLPTKNLKNLNVRKGYDDLLSIMENFIYKEKRVTSRNFTKKQRIYGNKKREKTARANKKKSYKNQANEKYQYTYIYPSYAQTEKCSPYQMTCNCYQCVENRLGYTLYCCGQCNNCNCYQCVENRMVYTCDCCGQCNDTVQHVNSVFSEKGSMICFMCYQSESCPGCGWEAGGLCTHCRRDY
jgi:hypothetical protein